MANQFIRYETYGLASRNGKQTIWGVIAEAERVPTHSKHVAAVKPPKLIYGCNPSALVDELEQAAAKARDRTGKRKLPKDAKLLLAGVVSMPLKSSELLEAHRLYVQGGKQDKPAALRLYQRWQRKSVDFLVAQYGDCLRSVLLHHDEEFIHLHYYTVAKPTGGTLNLDGLDVAGDAERLLGMDRKTRNKSGAERKAVRTEALKAFQDKYYELVGKALGWSRSTAKNPHLTRKEYVREKARVTAVQNAEKKTETLSKEVLGLSATLSSSRKLYNEVVNDLAGQVEAIKGEIRKLKFKPEPDKLEQLESQLQTIAKKLKI